MEFDDQSPSPHRDAPLPAENPYASGDVQVVALEPDPTNSLDVSNSRRRFWPTIIIPVIALVTFFVGSGVMALLAIIVVHGSLSMEILQDQTKVLSVSRSRIGLFIMVVLPQFFMVAPAIIAAFLSPTPWLKRLSLVRGNWPIWAWFAAAAATPLVGLISGIVVGQFMEESESLKEMSQIFRDHGQSGFLIPLALMIGATPAVCEELLFRGYIQTRLTSALHPVVGIGVASLLFAGFHMDPVHVIAVFPLGVFLGIVSWRSGSLVPAMLGHFVNNVISVVAVVIAPEGETDVLSAPSIMISLSIMFFGLLGFALTVLAAVKYGPPTDPESSPTVESADRAVQDPEPFPFAQPIPNSPPVDPATGSQS